MTKFSTSQQSQLAQIGAFLRENRESQGKSLEDIAIRTYIRPQLLSGIETGDPDQLPEPIFVQGFIRRYAETLGLQGTEISQQFTVTSIPSTPRPAPRLQEAESSTTRLTRRATTARPYTPSTTANTSASAPLFNAGSLSSQGEHFPNSTQDTADSVAAQHTSPSVQPEKKPLIVEDEVLGLPDEATTLPAIDASAIAPSTIEIGALDTGAVVPPSLQIQPSEDASSPSLSTADLTLDLPAAAVESDGPGDISAFDQAVLETSSPVTPSVVIQPDDQLNDNLDNSLDNRLDGQPINDRPINDGSIGGESIDNRQNDQFNDNLPAAFTTEVATTPETAERTPVYSDEPVGVEIDREGPNLKPFAIGAVVIAALIAGVVLLANALGGDRTPVVADNPTPDVEQLEDPAVIEPEALPPVPAPVSDAPVYVEANAIAEAWVSVIADGSEIFEGTLQSGDTQLWEAQETLDVFSGDGGALEIAANGGEAEVMGERGFEAKEVFTPR